MISAPIFLGWDKQHLDTAAAWLVENHGEHLHRLTIALPGRRAVRGLEERLARLAPTGGQAELVSLGQLSDQIVDVELPRASDLTRMLAWVDSLQQLSKSDLQLLAANPPAADDLNGWLNLAQLLRTLHGNLAAEMLDFADVILAGDLPGGTETRRWKVLGKIQQGYRAKLEELGQCDPHEARRAAINAGRVASNREIWLLGITDINQLQRRTLEAIGDKVHSLVFAPEDCAHLFDQFGCVDIDAWSGEDLELPLAEETWSVANQPQDQAEACVRQIASFNGKLAAQEITVAVLDDEVIPYLERALHHQGVPTHNAAGKALRTSSPWKLLEAVANWVDQRSAHELAIIARHFELGEALGTLGAAAELDDYHQKHLPNTLGKKLLGEAKKVVLLERLRTKLEQLLGGDRNHCAQARPPEEWLASIQRLLEAAWGNRELNEDNPAEAETVGALRKLSDAIHQLNSVPAGLMSVLKQPLAGTIRLLLRETADETLPETNDDAFIELVGWLELRLDSAKAAIVCGFNEGKAPESVHADPFLPDVLRQRLGMADNRARFARDAYALRAINGGNRSLHLICGRTSAEGDPFRPSRLLFQCAPETVAARMRRFLAGGETSGSGEASPDTAPVPLPRRDHQVELESMRVTDFYAFMRSPYEYYLTRTLNLKSIDDREREMNGLVFGNLIHKVLEDFGLNLELRECNHPEVILKELNHVLEQRCKQYFGNDPLPAVLLQIEQVRSRLRTFAGQQAARVDAGWRIVEAETPTPDGGVELVFEEEKIKLRAKIDRIDQHIESKKYQIIDYKTGDNPHKKPYSSRNNTWSDLQMPLYRRIVKKLGGYGEQPEVAYWSLPRTGAEGGLVQVEIEDADAWEEADHQAAEIIRAIRSGVDEDGNWVFASGAEQINDPILAAVAGQGLMEENDGNSDLEVESAAR